MITLARRTSQSLATVLCTVVLATAPSISGAQVSAVRGKQMLVLFDASSSAADSVIRREYLQAFRDIVRIPKEGKSPLAIDDPVFAAVVNSNPKSLIRLPFRFDPPPFSALSENRILAERRRTAALDSVDLVLRSAGASSETHIIEALDLVGRALTRLDRKKVLVIMSDMIEDSPVANFERNDLSATGIDAMIAKRRLAKSLPDLRGVSVWVVGASVGSEHLSAGRSRSIQEFWTRYFTACGATLPKGWYSAEPTHVERD